MYQNVGVCSESWQVLGCVRTDGWENNDKDMIADLLTIGVSSCMAINMRLGNSRRLTNEENSCNWRQRLHR